MTDIDQLERLLKQVAPNEASEITTLAKKLRDDLVKANRRAMQVRKELALPAGTIVISPDNGVWGVIGKDGLLDPGSVKPLSPDWSVGGVFYAPSPATAAGQPGADGSGQSLVGPGFVGKSGRQGLAAAVVEAQRSVRGAGSLRAAVAEAQEKAARGVMGS